MSQPWYGTVIASNHHTIQNSPQTLRDGRYNIIPVLNGGWHLSYFMTPEKIVEKLKSFVHQEYNQPPYTDVEYIKEKIEKGEDFLGKDTFIPYPINTLPESLVNSFSRGVA